MTPDVQETRTAAPIIVYVRIQKRFGPMGSEITTAALLFQSEPMGPDATTIGLIGRPSKSKAETADMQGMIAASISSIGRQVQNLSKTVLQSPLPTLWRLFWIAGAGAAAVWVLRFAYLTILWPDPLEFREGAAQVMTQLLLGGMNPFSMQNQPLGMNNYGIAYPLVVLPVAAILGNTLAVHRAVSTAFVIFSSILIGRTAIIATQHTGVSIACGVLAAMALIARAGIGAFPSSMGTFLYLAALLIPLNRGFDGRGLAASAFFSLIAFYTKPYFLLSFAIVASYVLFFHSTRKAVHYAALFGILFGLSFGIVRFAFPLYFVDVIISNISNTTRDWGHVWEQLQQLSSEFLPTLLGGFALLLSTLAGARHALRRLRNGSNMSGAGFEGRGFSRIRVDFLAYALMCSAIVFVLVLGPHLGGYMTYAYQLVVPLFLLWFAQEGGRRGGAKMLVMTLLIINLLVFGLANLNAGLLRQSARSTKEWARLYRWVDHSSSVLNSPVIVSRMVDQGMHVADSGQTEYYFGIRPYPAIPWVAPAYQDVRDNGLRYVQSIRSSIVHHEFDTIIIGGRKGFLDYDLIQQHYHRTATIRVDMPQSRRDWTLEIWLPLDGSAESETPG